MNNNLKPIWMKVHMEQKWIGKTELARVLVHIANIISLALGHFSRFNLQNRVKRRLEGEFVVERSCYETLHAFYLRNLEQFGTAGGGSGGRLLQVIYIERVIRRIWCCDRSIGLEFTFGKVKSHREMKVVVLSLLSVRFAAATTVATTTSFSISILSIIKQRGYKVNGII